MAAEVDDPPAPRVLERRPTLESLRFRRWDTKRDGELQQAGTVEGRDPWVITWLKELANRMPDTALPSSVTKGGFVTLQQLKLILRQLPEDEVIKFNRLADEKLQQAVGTEGVQEDPLQVRLDAYLKKLQPQAPLELASADTSDRRYWTLVSEEGPPDYQWLLEQYERQQHAARVIQRAWRRWNAKCKEEGRPAWCLERDLRRAKADLRLAYEAARDRRKQAGMRKSILPKELRLKYTSLMLAQEYVSKIEQRDKLLLLQASEAAAPAGEEEPEELGCIPVGRTASVASQHDVLEVRSLASQIRATLEQVTLQQAIAAEQQQQQQQEDAAAEEEEDSSEEEEDSGDEGQPGQRRGVADLRYAGRVALQLRSSDAGAGLLQIGSWQSPATSPLDRQAVHRLHRHSYSGAQSVDAAKPGGLRSRLGASVAGQDAAAAYVHAAPAVPPMLIRSLYLSNGGSRSSSSSFPSLPAGGMEGASGSPAAGRALGRSATTLQPARQNRAYLLLQEMAGDDGAPSSSPPSPPPVASPGDAPATSPAQQQGQASPARALAPPLPPLLAPLVSTPGARVASASSGLAPPGNLTPTRSPRASWAAAAPASSILPLAVAGAAASPSSAQLPAVASASPLPAGAFGAAAPSPGSPIHPVLSPMHWRHPRTSADQPPGALLQPLPQDQQPGGGGGGLHVRTSLTSQQAPAPLPDVRGAASCLRMLLREDPQGQGHHSHHSSVAASPLGGFHSPVTASKSGLRTPGSVAAATHLRRSSATGSGADGARASPLTGGGTPTLPPVRTPTPIEAAFSLISAPHDADPYVRQQPRQHPGLSRKPAATQGSLGHSPLASARTSASLAGVHRSTSSALVMEQAQKLQLGIAGAFSPCSEQQGGGSALIPSSLPSLGTPHSPAAAESPATSLMGQLLAARRVLKHAEAAGGGAAGSGAATLPL